MRAVIILIILAVGGWFGYRYWFAEEADAEGLAGPAPAVLPDAAVDGGDAAPDLVAAAGEGGGGTAAETPDPILTDPGPADALAPALAELKASTDSEWAALAAAGNDPTTSDQAPTLAAQYSRVLRGTYGKDALKDLAQELIETRLKPLADKIFFTPTPYFDDPSGLIEMYAIQAGDDLNAIGRTVGMSYQFINIARGTDAEDGLYHPGDRLKLFQVKDKGYQIHIDKSDFRMDVYVGGVFARRYPIGIGEDVTPTPAGTTHITAREKYPQWTDPKTNRVYQYGEEGHILGPVWLAFDPKLGRNGLGIHGYTGADGRATNVKASNGCIRMRNEDALELYNIMVPCGVYQSGFISRAPMNVTVVE